MRALRKQVKELFAQEAVKMAQKLFEGHTAEYTFLEKDLSITHVLLKKRDVAMFIYNKLCDNYKKLK